MSPVTVRSLTLSRYYLTLAKEHARSDREADAFVAINLLHEAVETFLVAAAEHLNVPIKARTEFATYLDRLDQAVAPQRLPFRTMLNRLNKTRVQAKHDSIVPDRAEIPNFVASTQSFLEESSDILFRLTFSSVSLINLLNDGEVKEHLAEAQNALDEHAFKDVLIECRKALYMVFEKPFDVSVFASNETSKNALWPGLFCTAPVHARSKTYIDERVCEPFDFIVLDHSRIDSDLVKDGLEPLIFWNLWRLTPQVFRTPSGEWLVKNEPDKFAETTANDNASYVLENTINLIHQRERKRRAIKTTSYNKWQLRVRNPGANIYKKASRTSEVVGNIPDGLEHMPVQSGTPALDGDGTFWRVFNISELGAGGWLSGYVHEEDLSFD